ncbi:hypothetical protein AAFC00_001753 [Neodothiora populina]|uniref:Sec20 C-terminal domain-containing protein n=1 Tax=Neodothiora populina TaxID=2781224 RepID=A0ABR3PQ10_9PEZI
MSASSVSANIAALSDQLKVTFQLINRLSKSTSQTPATTPQDEHDQLAIDLVQDIREHLKQNEDSLDQVKQEVDDLISQWSSGTHRRRDSIKERERARTAAQVARLEEEVTHARSRFRKAQLTSKHASEAAKQREREALLAGLQQQPSASSSPSPSTDLFAGRKPQQSRQLTQDEILVNASGDVTSALRRTHDLLTSELSRSRFAQETLDQSTAALADLGERYSGLDSLLSSSKSLLGTLVRSQKSDTWYLETAFYILVATLCWLIFRRIIYGPAWWFIWLPLKYLLFKPFLYIFAAFGITSRAQPSSDSLHTALSSRPPLRVQPSASGAIPTFRMSHEDRQAAPGVPVGGGGMGAKKGPDGKYRDPSPPGSLSQKIGQMAEAGREEMRIGGASVEEEEEPVEVVRRGDGTILQERGETPRNPKKKQWEEDVEAANHQHRKRDEL